MPSSQTSRFDKILVGVSLTVLAFTAASSAVAPAEVFAEEAEAADIEEFDLAALLEAPIVESASKRRQSLDDAPASLTVITEDDIRRSSSVYVTDVLREVVGVHVLQVAPNSFFVGARGINGLTNMRTALLVDGRRSADVGNSDPLWSALPVHPADIERIEVIRGPGSTLYGADAYSGVFSITTKRPLSHPGIEAHAAGGVYAVQDDPNNLHGQASGDILMTPGGNGYVAYGWLNDDGDVGVRGSVGFNSNPDQHAVPETSAISHGTFGYHARLATEVEFDEQSTLYVVGSHVFAEGMNGNTAQNYNRNSARSEQALSVRFDDLEFVDEMLALRATADVWRLSTASTTLREDAFRTTEPEQLGVAGGLQLDLSLWDERNVLSVGGEVTHKQTEDFFDVEPTILRLGAYLQNETAFLEDRSLVLNLATRLESIRMSDGGDVESTYDNITPRGSLIWKFTEEQSLRVGMASAYRTPNPFESYVSINYRSNPEPAPENISIRNNATLEPERVRSAEIGYRAALFESLRLDFVVFGQQVLDLVDIAPENRSPLQWENAHDLTQIGTEVDINAALASWLSGYVHYTFVHSQNEDSSRASSFFPEHIFGLGIDASMPGQWQINARTTVTSGYAPRFFARAPVGGFTLQEFEQPTVTRLDLRLAKLLYDGELEVFLSGRNLLGFFADTDSLREFPSPYHAPTGTSVLVGLSLSPHIDSE